MLQNVNLFHGEKVLAEEDIVEEQTELIFFKSPVDGNLGQLFLDVPMKCKKQVRILYLYVWKTKVIYVILCRLETWGISM